MGIRRTDVFGQAWYDLLQNSVAPAGFRYSPMRETGG